MRLRTPHGARLSVVLGLLALANCGAADMDGADQPKPSSGPPEAPAPERAAQVGLTGEIDCKAVSWTAQVKPFAQRYCVRCHTTPLIARPGEVTMVGLDDEPAWLEHGLHALEMINLGIMPLGAPFPTEDEVERLKHWLACEENVRPHAHE